MRIEEIEGMKKNVIFWDRTLRFILGVFLLAWAVAGGPVWSFVGVYFLATGAWGYCPLYSLMNYQPFEED